MSRCFRLTAGRQADSGDEFRREAAAARDAAHAVPGVEWIGAQEQRERVGAGREA